VPALVVAPGMEAVWLGAGELAVLLTGENGIRVARLLFAVSLIPIGLSHLVYAKATADLVPAAAVSHRLGLFDRRRAHRRRPRRAARGPRSSSPGRSPPAHGWWRTTFRVRVALTDALAATRSRN
jgi:hypothetical protein